MFIAKFIILVIFNQLQIHENDKNDKENVIKRVHTYYASTQDFFTLNS